MENVGNDFSGIYRAVVIDNRDEAMQGKVQVWIPDLMPEISQDKGIWASPANNPVGGRNEEYDESHVYMGTSYIPQKGSFVFVFFEKNDPRKPWYFGGCNLENTTVLPENQVGSEKENKWVVFKSAEGRCVVISDDPDDRRVEITGKKRNISNPPSGDTESVYTIDSNQSTVLLDEREGKEKVLIRTHKGDYLHIDIDEQRLHAEFSDEIRIKCGSTFSLESKEFQLKTSGDVNLEGGGAVNVKAGSDVAIGAGGNATITAASVMAADGSTVKIQEGASLSPSSAQPESPEGQRDT